MPMRRDGEGKLSGGPSWESLAERLIREAMERGEFDDLPYRGQRIPLEDETLVGDNRLGFHVLKNAGVAPPWIEADKAARAALAARDALLERAPAATTGLAREQLRRRFAEAIETANAAIARLNAEAPTPGQHRRLLRPDLEVAELERRFAEQDA